MMLRFSKKAVWSKQALLNFQNTQIMSNVSVMPICPHHRQYPESVWAVKKYCFGIGINLDNNCYNCLAWQKTVRHDVSWVWLGQIGIDVKMICWAKITTKPRQAQKIARGMPIPSPPSQSGCQPRHPCLPSDLHPLPGRLPKLPRLATEAPAPWQTLAHAGKRGKSRSCLAHSANNYATFNQRITSPQSQHIAPNFQRELAWVWHFEFENEDWWGIQSTTGKRAGINGDCVGKTLISWKESWNYKDRKRVCFESKMRSKLVRSRHEIQKYNVASKHRFTLENGGEVERVGVEFKVRKPLNL